jgi:hypothetical protein
MMRDRKMFGEVVSFVVGTCSPFNFEQLLALTVLEPVLSRVNGFGAALLDGLVGNADNCGVVTGVGGWGCPISSSAMQIGIASIQL